MGRESRATVDPENANGCGWAQNGAKFSVRDFGVSIREPASILLEASTYLGSASDCAA